MKYQLRETQLAFECVAIEHQSILFASAC